jgi:2-keto-4-pentenoate hydratase/2-oxohepta-3-ene-1,7-dioic acid hydratase in catechol pathway
VSFQSQGATLEKGTVILTDAPAGVATDIKPIHKNLQNGDVVEVREKN